VLSRAARFCGCILSPWYVSGFFFCIDFSLVVSFLGVACFCGVPSRARAISRVFRNRHSMRPLSCHLYHSPPAKVNSGPANFHFDAPLPPKNATSSDPSTSAVYPGVSISRTLRGPRLADKLGHTTPNLPLLAVSREPNVSAPKKHPNKVRQAIFFLRKENCGRPPLSCFYQGGTAVNRIRKFHQSQAPHKSQPENMRAVMMQPTGGGQGFTRVG